MSYFRLRNKKNSRNQISNILAETEQILKIGEDTKTKGRILKKIHGRCQFLNILVSFNGFGLFLKKESKKQWIGF